MRQEEQLWSSKGEEMKKRLNNRGVSLVELLVAMAVGAIVLAALIVLIQQSIKGYNSQTITSQLQNDTNITLNQIEESVMEATEMTIYDFKGGTDDTDNTQKFATKSNVVYRYDSTRKTLYLANNIDQNATGYTESVLCENVSSFRVKLISTSVLYSGDKDDENRTISGINKPVRVAISLTLDKKNITREASKESNTRNILTDITLMLGTQPTKIAVNHKSYKDIKAYIKNS